MGAAHCSVVNQTTRPLCVVTFNMADLMYKTYHTMYIVDPGDIQVVEANPDAIGLKVGVIYDAKRFKQEFSFHRFTCQNDCTLTVTSIDGDDIDYYGEGTNLQGKNTLRELDVDAFNLAASSLRVDLARESDKPINPATEDVKKFISNVKHKSEEVLTKVTGKEVSLDIAKTGFLGPDGNMVRSPSSTSVSHIHVSNSNLSNDDYNGSMHTGSEHSKPQVKIAVSSSQQSNSPSSTPSKVGVTVASSRASPVDVPTSSNNSMSQNANPDDSRAAMERWEAELERLKKEKKWEQEVERVRKDRQQRAELEEEFQHHPENFPQINSNIKISDLDGIDSSRKQVTVVEKAGCSVCVIS